MNKSIGTIILKLGSLLKYVRFPYKIDLRTKTLPELRLQPCALAPLVELLAGRLVVEQRLGWLTFESQNIDVTFPTQKHRIVSKEKL